MSTPEQDRALAAVAARARARVKADDAMKAAMRAARASGASLREIAAAAQAQGVKASHTTVNGWLQAEWLEAGFDGPYDGAQG